MIFTFIFLLERPGASHGAQNAGFLSLNPENMVAELLTKLLP